MGRPLSKRKCEIEGCSKKHVAKGLCWTHYFRNLRNGSPNTIIRVRGENREKNPLYKTYCEMLRRCDDPNRSNYKYYGAKGVTVCDRWRGPTGFNNFCDDMGNKPTDDHSIDRINPYGNYEPTNCRWATAKEQAQNRRSAWEKQSQ